ncbi:calmodulin [Patella vulgata]|uniref:calmodulin n=1 Tax=Patella vulgata TaxID=6465 RepID=UPI00217FB2CC|nr:calmodulin [Patella vulgata]
MQNDTRKSSTVTLNDVPKVDEDVTLTEDQRIELKEAFSLFEGKGKGKINVRDLGALLRCLGWNPSERDMEEAKRELEVNTRGHIPFADIERYVARRGGIYWDNNDEEDILTAFQALDRNGCGKIKVDDFKHFMMTMGEQMSQEEVEELVECTTKESERGVIDYKDLVKAVKHIPT